MVPIVPMRRRSSGPGIFRLFVLERDEADLLAFAQRLFDELDAGSLHDRERDDGVREQHRVLQREDAEDLGGLVGFRHYAGVLLTVMRICVRTIGYFLVWASGSRIDKMPSR